MEIREVAALGEVAAEEVLPLIRELGSFPDAMTRRLRYWFSPEDTSRYGS